MKKFLLAIALVLSFGTLVQAQSASINSAGVTTSLSSSGIIRFSVCSPKTLSNTSGTATSIVDISVPTGNAGCAEWTTSVAVADVSGNADAESQTCNVCWYNKLGTATVGSSVCTASVAIGSLGSTTVGTTVTVATNIVSIKVTPVFTTIVPTSVISYITLRNNSAGVVTCN